MSSFFECKDDMASDAYDALSLKNEIRVVKQMERDGILPYDIAFADQKRRLIMLFEIANPLPFARILMDLLQKSFISIDLYREQHKLFLEQTFTPGRISENELQNKSRLLKTLTEIGFIGPQTRDSKFKMLLANYRSIPTYESRRKRRSPALVRFDCES